MERIKQFGRYTSRIFNRSQPKEEIGDFNFVTNFREENVSIVWRIENIHLCALKSREFLESPTFCTRSCSEVKWSLRLYPRSTRYDNGRLKIHCAAHEGREKSCLMVGLFIHKLSKGPVTSAFRGRLSYKRYLLNNTLFTYPEEDEVDVNMDVTNSFEYGKENFFCAESLETPQTLFVKCKIYITNAYNRGASGTCTQGFPKSDSLLEDLKAMYENRRFSDITLQTGNEVFPAHKAILASRSEVFRAMFQYDMKETQTNVVQVEDDPALLDSLLQYIYTGSVDNFNIEKAIDLYPVADKYLLHELKNWCVDIMLVNMKVENVCQIAVLADLHPDPKLKIETFNMFRAYTSDIFKRKEWHDLVRNADQRALVSDILKAVTTDFTKNSSECFFNTTYSKRAT